MTRERDAPVPDAPPSDAVAPDAVAPRRPLPASAFLPALNLDELLAAVAMLALGLREFVYNGTTSGYLLVFVLIPVWIGSIRRYRGASVVLMWGLITTVWGVIQSDRSAPGNITIGSDQRSDIVLMLGTVAGIGAVLWSRRVMGIARTGIFYGLGMVLGAGAGFTPAAGNPWKFVWAVPVAVLLLSLVARGRRTLLEVAALLVLGLASVVFDSRSYFASFLLSALLVLWQMRPVALSRRRSWALTAVLMGGIATAVYYLGSTLLVSGYLGTAAQARSVAEIDTSGSLILGGRPELGATIALIKDRPGGFGAGTNANPNDVLVAKAGMKSLGYNPNNGYVERFMFGRGGIELHSMVGDLWAAYGLAGLAFAVLVLAFTVRGLAETVASRTASGLVLFLCCWTLWNLLFSPFYAAEPTLILTLGFVLGERHRRSDMADDPGAAARESQVLVRK